MNITVRRRKIQEMLQSKPFISLDELIEAFPEVSSMTLRRDIEFFEEQGEAIKVRGGARSMKFITTSMEDSFTSRLNENIDAKERIAAKAAQIVEPGRSIFLDSGTTMLTLAAAIPDERVTITTTGPNVALEIIKKRRPFVNIVGGMLNRDNISVVGNQALNYINEINIDVAFIAPSGFSANGITCGNYTECELKKLVISKARKVVLMLDLSKLDRILPYTVCDLSEVDIVIADRPLPEDIINKLIEIGKQILLA